MQTAAVSLKTRKEEEIPELWRMILDDGYISSNAESRILDGERLDANRISQVDGRTLDYSQKAALLKSIESRKLFLLHGPPGTGKSTTLAAIITYHVSM